MKSGKARRIALLTATWLMIGAVWIVGLNWPRIVSGGAETVRSADSGEAQSDSGEAQSDGGKAQSDSGEAQSDGGKAQTVIYTLSDTLSDDDSPNADPLPERTVPEPAEPETTADPQAEPAPANPSPTYGTTGEDSVSPDPSPDPRGGSGAEPESVTAPYVLNTHTKKIHLPDCPSVTEMKESNRGFCEDPEEMLAQGYAWCKRCHG